MFNFGFFVIVLLVGLVNINARSIKRSEKSENNLEKVEDTEYPMKVNYDVYPVRKVSQIPVVTFSARPQLYSRLTSLNVNERDSCGARGQSS
jgi:hypothetical protein